MKDFVAADEESLSRYLLGDLPGESQKQVEQRLLADSEFFELLSVVEDELTDRYVRDELPPDDRRRFEGQFLSTPERRRQLRFARALQRHFSSEAARQTSSAWARSWTGIRLSSVWRFWSAPFSLSRWALGALVVILLLAGSFLAVYVRFLQADLGRLRARWAMSEHQQAQRLTQQRAQTERLAEELQHARGERARLEKDLLALQQSRAADSILHGMERSRSAVVAILLTPGLQRDPAGGKTLLIPHGAQRVRLELALPDGGYVSYRTVIWTVSGEQIWSQQVRPAVASGSPDRLLLDVPAGLLGNRDYLVSLAGVGEDGQFEDVAKYYFRVKRA